MSAHKRGSAALILGVVLLQLELTAGQSLMRAEPLHYFYPVCRGSEHLIRTSDQMFLIRCSEHLIRCSEGSEHLIRTSDQMFLIRCSEHLIRCSDPLHTG